jgi:hypothetical protein
VDDGADVRLVHAHPKRNRRDDDLQLAAKEVTLHLLAHLRAKAGMVGCGREVLVELRGELLSVLARLRVDDGRSRSRLLQKLQRELRPLRLRKLDDLNGEVAAAEAGNERSRLAQVELTGDVSLDRRRGCRRQGDDRCRPQRREMLA